MSARRASIVLFVVAALSAFLVATRVRLSPDIAELLPDRGDAAALARWLRAFGGGDPGLVLVEAADAALAEEASRRVVVELAGARSVVRAYDALPLPEAIAPSQAILLADRTTWPALERALSREGMASRLAETRALLLAPGGATIADTLARDPLRLAELALAPASASLGAFVSDDGRARLVVVEPRGSSLKSEDARAFVTDVRAAIARTRVAHPSVTIGLAGGHAIAEATERRLRRDLTFSSILATVLASLVFVAIQRRPRALVAIVPPLVMGTVITAAFAALFPRGLSALSVAFASVVVGVGMDTGVHLHAATRDARAAGSKTPAADARAKTGRAVLGAAAVAAAAFGCLALSRVEALRQLGILAAIGELATAIALLIVTPEIAAWLERSAVPAKRAAWAAAVPRVADHRWAARGAIAAGVVATIALAFGLARPLTDGGVIALRPVATDPDDPNAVYERLSARLGRSDAPPLVVVIDDPDDETARARADEVFEALAARRDVVHALGGATNLAPSARTLAGRLRARETLALPARADDLASALRAAGFSPDRFADALDDLRHPAPPAELADARAALSSRFFARSEGSALAIVDVVAEPGREDAVEAIVRTADTAARVTGLGRLDRVLRATLEGDLPRIGALAIGLALVTLWLTLRRAADVALAFGVVVAEIALVLVAMRALGVPLHVYDALVLPVLLGVTLDEVLFVLLAVRAGGGDEAARAAVVHEAPLVATTALTTAAGFGALLVCGFAPLRHLGATGAIGSVVGLVLALVVVPALTLTRR